MHLESLHPIALPSLGASSPARPQEEPSPFGLPLYTEEWAEELPRPLLQYCFFPAARPQEEPFPSSLPPYT